MRTILFLVRKEFLQIFRNKGILPILLIMPVIQLLILAYAVDYEIKNLNLFVVDYDQSQSSRLLTQKLESSDYFRLVDYSFDQQSADRALDNNKADLVLTIPAHFERELLRDGHHEIQVIANAINGTKAGLGSSYINQVIRDWNVEVRNTLGVKFNASAEFFNGRVLSTHSYWFNPLLNYKTFMVPGILVLLVTMIGGFVASMNIVREKELGTVEQLNVSPLKKYQFILGKLIPLWLIGVFEFTIGLLVAYFFFSVPIVGSLWVVYLFTSLYLIMILGFGMTISTLTDTQQQAMFVAWFFLVVFIIMSGLFTPIENMPDWAQKITYINPIRYFIEVIRLVLLKGAGLVDIKNQILIISGYALLINSVAIWRYRKTV